MAEPENEVAIADEERDPIDCLHTATHCLPNYDPSIHHNKDSPPFLYWKIRDYAHAYRSNVTTPSVVCYLHVFFLFIILSRTIINSWMSMHAVTTILVTVLYNLVVQV